MRIAVVSLVCAVAGSLSAATVLRPVNTYSIIAYDSTTGQFGAAVQSHWFKVADVIWVEPGVGAVATQSLVDFAYGPLGLEMLRYGRNASDALAGLLRSDSGRELRQVAIVDKRGRVATHTGNKCIAAAGHKSGPGYSVQANLMRNATVWDAMERAWLNTRGDMAERLMAALEAAEREGGDIRGKQSAAIVVVSGQPTGQPWRDKLVDLRVDDSEAPLAELRRLLNISRAYDLMNRGDEFIAGGQFEQAQRAYDSASVLAPGNLEILFWYAVTLTTNQHVEEALPIFKHIFKQDTSWRELVPRLVPSGLLPDDKELITRITAQ